jgi:hypothetical protein
LPRIRLDGKSNSPSTATAFSDSLLGRRCRLGHRTNKWSVLFGRRRRHRPLDRLRRPIAGFRAFVFQPLFPTRIHGQAPFLFRSRSQIISYSVPHESVHSIGKNGSTRLPGKIRKRRNRG